MKRTNCSFALGFAGLLVVGCGYREAAPPQAPAKEMPKVVEPRTTPPEPGTTRVILDANGEKATVTEILDETSTIATAYAQGSTATAYGYSETTKAICVAPCAVDLKPGMHVLRFHSNEDDRKTSVANVQVGDRSKVVRHAIGHTDGFSFGQFGGSLLVAFGATALGGGALMYGLDSADHDHSDAAARQPAELATAAAGAGAILVGAALMLLMQPVHQPGATTEMALNR